MVRALITFKISGIAIKINSHTCYISALCDIVLNILPWRDVAFDSLGTSDDFYFRNDFRFDHIDTAHSDNSSCREEIQSRQNVITAKL